MQLTFRRAKSGGHMLLTTLLATVGCNGLHGQDIAAAEIPIVSCLGKPKAEAIAMLEKLGFQRRSGMILEVDKADVKTWILLNLVGDPIESIWCPSSDRIDRWFAPYAASFKQVGSSNLSTLQEAKMRVISVQTSGRSFVNFDLGDLTGQARRLPGISGKDVLRLLGTDYSHARQVLGEAREFDSNPWAYFSGFNDDIVQIECRYDRRSGKAKEVLFEFAKHKGGSVADASKIAGIVLKQGKRSTHGDAIAVEVSAQGVRGEWSTVKDLGRSALLLHR